MRRMHSRGAPRLWRRGLAVLLGLAGLWHGASAHADEPPRRILILHAYNYTFPSTSVIADSVRERLHRRSPQKIELAAEYLDLVRFSEPGQEQLMVTFLRDRYAPRRPDVILVIGPEATQFAIRHRDTFAPGAPVVFVGLSRTSHAAFPAATNVTGNIIELSENLEETLALAERLQPAARRLAVIAGAATTDRRWQTIARELIERRARKLETTYLFELSHDALLTAVARLPGDAIVIALSVLRDGAGKAFVPAEVNAALAAVSPAPVYSPYADHVGARGVAGGYGESFDAMGRAAADMILEILAGKDPSAIAPRVSPERSHRVDYRALQRWSLGDGNLPPGTIVLHKPPSIWDQHRGLVLATLAVLVLQTAFAAALLVQGHRRRRAELLLKESEERMTFTAASVNIGLWQFNRETGELWATEHCRALFGLGRDVPLTRETVLQAVHPEDRDAAISALRDAAGTARPAVHDVRIVLPDGEVRWVRVRARAHSDGNATPDQLSGIFVDITDRKTAESEAALQRQEVAHLMRVSVLGELSGAIAHEINQPLAAILSNAQAALYLLGRESPDLAEVRDALQDIVQEDNRAGEVIQRLRALLKKGDARLEPVDINELARSTIALLRSELVTRRIDVEAELAEGLCAVSGDPVQLQQVLLNVILNALDAMASAPRAQRRVTVSTRETPAGAVEVLVKDRGEGIREADRLRLLEPFFTTKSQGLGLGLTICSSIVQAHGGTMTLANSPDGGALVTLSLPAQAMLIAAQ